MTSTRPMAGQDTTAGTRATAREDRDDRHTISTHVLDTETGQPAAGVPVRVGRVLADGAVVARRARARTDADGRISALLESDLTAGVYRITFEVHQYRAAVLLPRGRASRSTSTDTSRSYHVPLLVAPFGVSSYRGS